MSDISNSADIIDSRDIIARIEELEAQQEHWVAGCNMPGYMPDSDPSGFADWDDARDSIVSDLEQARDDLPPDEELSEREQRELAAINEGIDAMKALKDGQELTVYCGTYCYWVTRNADPALGLDDDDAKELKALKELADEGEGFSDWADGVTLIRDSYFKDYAQELADDLGLMGKEQSWPYTCIDWDQAARELRMDYSSIDYAGVTYWAR